MSGAWPTAATGAEDAGLTLGLGLAAATTSVLILVLYIIESAWPSGLLLPRRTGCRVAPVVLAMWLMRVWAAGQPWGTPRRSGGVRWSRTGRACSWA